MNFWEKVKANFNPVMFFSTMAGVAAVGLIQYLAIKSKIKPLAKTAKATKGQA